VSDQEAGPNGPASSPRGYTPGVMRGAVLAAAFVAAVCSGTAAAGQRSAVLHGTVLLAPATPVCMPRIPCMRPASNVVLAFSRGGIVRARATTDADGSYRLSLRAGTYDVRVVRPTGVRRLTPASVRLYASEVKRVTFYLDTGIR
jgi:Carboxypeptidase regulatory-like domain